MMMMVSMPVTVMDDDGDGYLEVKKGERVYSVGFSTTSKVMAEDISRLLVNNNYLVQLSPPLASFL